MKLSARHRQEAGLTIMEVMIALAVLAVISTLIWSAFSQSSSNRKVIEKSLDRYHQVAVAFEKIAGDLSMGHLSRNTGPVEKSSFTEQAGFLGRNEDPDTLDFTTFSHQRRFLDAKEGDRCEVGYSVEEDDEKKGMHNLVRRETTRVDDKPERGGKYTVLVEDVVSFDLEYYDMAMDKWEKEWDTTQATGFQGRLPLQVRVYLTVYDEYDREVDFATQITLDLQMPVIFSGG